MIIVFFNSIFNQKGFDLILLLVWNWLSESLDFEQAHCSSNSSTTFFGPLLFSTLSSFIEHLSREIILIFFSWFAFEKVAVTILALCGKKIKKIKTMKKSIKNSPLLPTGSLLKKLPCCLKVVQKVSSLTVVPDKRWIYSPVQCNAVAAIAWDPCDHCTGHWPGPVWSGKMLGAVGSV